MPNYLDRFYSGYLARAGQPEYLPEYSFLSSYLKGATGGMPFKDELLQTSTGAIRRRYDTASRDLASNLSARGVGGSGISLAAQNQLLGSEATALNEATSAINAQDINFRQNAIAQLLGLSQAQGQFQLGQQGQGLQALGQLTQYNQFEQDLNQRRRAATLGFWGQLLGGVGQAAGGYLARPSPGSYGTGQYPSGGYYA